MDPGALGILFAFFPLAFFWRECVDEIIIYGV